MKDELIQLIEDIKKAESLTQYEVAEKLGYEHTYLSQLLNGKKPISKKLLEKVKLTFPSVSNKVDALRMVQEETAAPPPPIDDRAYPILAKNSNNAEKLDTLLLFMQQHSKELKGLNHKLNELEQQQIVSAAIQTQFQEYLVSKLDVNSDPEITVVEMQRKAFERLTRIPITDRQRKVNNSHR